MLNLMLDFIANHPYLVLLNCLMGMLIMTYIGAHIRRYENAYEIPHVLSNAIILVIITVGCGLIYGVSQTRVEVVKEPAYKDLDMTQTFVFNPETEQKKDDTDGLLTKGYQALFGKEDKEEDPTVDTSKTITADMVEYLKDREGLDTTMVVSKDGQKTEQDVLIDEVTVKGDLQRGDTAKITKVSFKKPNVYRFVIFGHEASHTHTDTNDGSVKLTIEVIDNPVNKQFD